jgi:hypothetical protein
MSLSPPPLSTGSGVPTFRCVTPSLFLSLHAAITLQPRKFVSTWLSCPSISRNQLSKLESIGLFQRLLLPPNAS